MIHNLEKKGYNYKMELRKINRENLKLMEQINKFENELSFKLSKELDNFNYNLKNNNNNINNINNENPINNLFLSNNSENTNNANNVNNNILSTKVNNNSQSINGLNYSNL